MRYEWDEAKRQKVLQKHGYDLADAAHIYEHPSVVSMRSAYPNEVRFIDLAEWGRRVVALVYAMRSGAVRVISLRAAGRE